MPAPVPLSMVPALVSVFSEGEKPVKRAPSVPPEISAPARLLSVSLALVASRPVPALSMVPALVIARLAVPLPLPSTPNCAP